MIANLLRLRLIVARSSLYLLLASLTLLPVMAEAQEVTITGPSKLNQVGYDNEVFEVADVDLDGWPDLVESYWGHSYTKYGYGPPIEDRKGHGLRWYKGPDLNKVTSIVSVSGSGASEFERFVVADFNRDGRMDLLGSKRISPEYPFCLIKNIADTATKTLQGVNSSVYPLVTCDLNHDNYPDFAGALDYTICWYENNKASNTAFTSHTIHSFLQVPAGIIVTDIDRDGNQDFLVDGQINRSGDFAGAALYRGKGGKNPVFTEDILTTDSTIWDVVDFDRDGDQDIILWAYETSAVDWLENLGASPPKFIRRQLSSIDNSNGNRITGKFCDLDGDMDFDILGFHYRSYGSYWLLPDVHIVYLENQGGSPLKFQEHYLGQIARGGYETSRTYINGVITAHLHGNANWQIVVGMGHTLSSPIPIPNGGGESWGSIELYNIKPIPPSNGIEGKFWNRYP